MHPLAKYMLALLAAFAIAPSLLAREDIPLWDLEGKPTSLAALAKSEPLFLALFHDYQRIDGPLRFITLVDQPKYADRANALICLPLSNTSPLARQSKAALVKRYISGEFMRSRLYFVGEDEIQSLLGSAKYALLTPELDTIWTASSYPSESHMMLFDQAVDRCAPPKE